MVSGASSSARPKTRPTSAAVTPKFVSVSISCPSGDCLRLQFLDSNGMAVESDEGVVDRIDSGIEPRVWCTVPGKPVITGCPGAKNFAPLREHLRRENWE